MHIEKATTERIKAKGLPDGSNVFLDRLPWNGQYMIYRVDEHGDRQWFARTSKRGLAEYIYCFED